MTCLGIFRMTVNPAGFHLHPCPLDLAKIIHEALRDPSISLLVDFAVQPRVPVGSIRQVLQTMGHLIYIYMETSLLMCT